MEQILNKKVRKLFKVNFLYAHCFLRIIYAHVSYRGCEHLLSR